MLRIKTLVVLTIVVAAELSWTSQAEAGPLLDWIRARRCARAARTCAPQQACAPQPCATTCQTTCQQTCSRIVVNYVPYTAYRTSWEKVPVTTYRQTTSTDPCTGCTVTCQRPCTTYTWRMKQVPYTTYRACYRRETYQVPVTYTTQMVTPQVGAPATQVMPATPGCSTCAVGTPAQIQAPVGTLSPNTSTPYYQSTPAPGGTIIQQPTGTPTPADARPSLSPQDVIQSQSSAYWPNQIQSQPSSNPTTTGTGITPIQDPDPASRWQNDSAPQLLNPFDKSASVPSVQKWNYSPVRLASYQTPVSNEQPQQTMREYVGTLEAVPTSKAPQTQPKLARVNEGWRGSQ